MSGFPETSTGLAAHWKRAAQAAAEYRQRDLRTMTDEEALRNVDDLINLALQFGSPRTTSGLLEMRRRMDAAWGRQSGQEPRVRS